MKRRLDLGSGGRNEEAPANRNINPYNGRAFSSKYHQILAMRIQLPVYEYKEAFLKMYHANRIILLVGETGSGYEFTLVLYF